MIERKLKKKLSLIKFKYLKYKFLSDYRIKKKIVFALKKK